jgi:hypothetical protein
VACCSLLPLPSAGPSRTHGKWKHPHRAALAAYDFYLPRRGQREEVRSGSDGWGCTPEPPERRYPGPAAAVGTRRQSTAGRRLQTGSPSLSVPRRFRRNGENLIAGSDGWGVRISNSKLGVRRWASVAAAWACACGVRDGRPAGGEGVGHGSCLMALMRGQE